MDRPRTGARRAARPARARRAVAWLVLAALALFPPGLPAAWAGPSGHHVVEGEVDVRYEGKLTVIDSESDAAIIDWSGGFDIAPDETVRVEQPHDAARLMNKVLDDDPTRIDGRLEGNGLIYIVNPYGVFIGGKAEVDVGGLIAAAGEISNDDFLAGIDRFTDLVGAVENHGTIHAHSAALIGRAVANHGKILAEGGMVALVAGEQVLLSSLDGSMVVRVEGPPEEDPADLDGWAIEQTGHIEAGSGSVSLTVGDTYSLALNHTGITRGRDIRLDGGEQGMVAVAGELDASDRSPGGTGGRVEVLGDRVAVRDAVLDASGDAGGGSIRVGGDRRGDGTLRTARRTYVSDEAALHADALRDGDGGDVVIWSEEKTGFYGTLTARGGAEGGDGGFAEISGARSLDARPDLDLTAAKGGSGTLLYDPLAIEIHGTDGTVNAMDGSDTADGGAEDPALLLQNSDVEGQVLAAEVGDADPFIVFESEIESTDANIVLEATERVEAKGKFGDTDGDGVDDVVLIGGNSFVVRLNPDGSEGTDSGPKIDLTGGRPIEEGGEFSEEITWAVSGDGAVLIQAGSTQGGDISVDDIQTDGDLESVLNDADLLTGSVQIFTAAGDIKVGHIDTRGKVENPAELSRGPSGGVVLIAAGAPGDIIVEGIDARGYGVSDIPKPDGSGFFSPDDADAPAMAGGDGGVVILAAAQGSVRVGPLGADRSGPVIQLDGGDGTAIQRDESGFPERIGGSGGTLDINTAEIDGDASVLVDGDISAVGGEARGPKPVDMEESPDEPFARGGLGGGVDVEADGAFTVTGNVDLSGGDSDGDGGPGGQIVVGVASGDVSLGDLTLKGGDSRFQSGGDGGSVQGAGGLVGLGAEDGNVTVGAIDTRGGQGNTDDDEGFGNGGFGGTVSVAALVTPADDMDTGEGRGVVSIESIDTRGGSGNATSLASLENGGPDASTELGDVLSEELDEGSDRFLGNGGIGGDVSVRAARSLTVAGEVVGQAGVGIATNGGTGAGRQPTLVVFEFETDENGEIVRDENGDPVPSDFSFLISGPGGAAGDVDLVVDQGAGADPADLVVTGSIEATGGISESGRAGFGGTVSVSTGTGSIEVGGIDTSAGISNAESGTNLVPDPDDPDGDLIEEVVFPETSDAGDIAIVAGTELEVGAEVDTIVGDVTLTGTLTANAGEVVNDKDENGVSARGEDGEIAIEARGSIQGGGAPGTVHIASRGNATLTAVDVGLVGQTLLVSGGRRAETDEETGEVTREGTAFTASAFVPEQSSRRPALPGRHIDLAFLSSEYESVSLRQEGEGESLDIGDVNVDFGDDGSNDIEILGGTDASTVVSFDTTLSEAQVEYVHRYVRLAPEDEEAPDEPRGVLETADLVIGDGNPTTVMDLGGETSVATAGAIEAAAGALIHVQTQGTAAFEARSVGSTAQRLVANGTAGGNEVVAFEVGETLETELIPDSGDADPGDVYLDLGGDVERLEIVQHDATGTTSVTLPGGDEGIEIAGEDGVSTITRVNTLESDTAFVYGLVDEADDGSEPEVALGDGAAQLGGDLLLFGRGDVSVEEAAIAANDQRVLLSADADSDGSGALLAEGGSAAHVTGASELVLGAGGGIGTDADRVRIQDVSKLAARSLQGDVSVDNLEGGDVSIAEVELPEFASDEISDAPVGGKVVGLVADAGSVALANTEGRILLGTNSESLAESPHVSASGDVTLDGIVEIDNVQTTTNAARIVAGGDVTLGDRVDTSADATDGMGEVVAGTLQIESGGVTRFGGDVGGARRLARLETAGVQLDGEANEGNRFVVGEATFGGAIDASAPGQSLLVEDSDADGLSDRVTFGGDIGAGTALQSVSVNAEHIAFDGAQRMVTAGEGAAIALNQDGRDEVPDRATISSTGAMRFESSGSFEVGRNEKVSVLGGLAIDASEASFGDLTAFDVTVDAPVIRVLDRDPGPVRLTDDSVAMDDGVDIVANTVRFGSQPRFDDPKLKVVLGDGELRVPGNARSFEVLRIDPNGSRIGADDLVLFDGSILDLTNDPSRTPVVADPSTEIPQEGVVVNPMLRPRFGDEPPAPLVPVDDRQVLAFLRCAEIPGIAPAGCDSEAARDFAALGPLDLTPLATERAEDLTARYRLLVASPDGQAALRGSFSVAGRGFRQQVGPGVVDGASLYRFVEATPSFAEARRQLDDLAYLFTQLALMDLDASSLSRVEQALAEEFAAAARMPGLDVAALREAVQTSPVGLID